jgi:hypothetical protein
MNLWSDIHTNHQSTSRSSQRARSLNERAVALLSREWLLAEYAACYCRSLAATKIFRRCYWIDALGAGVGAGSSSTTTPSSISTEPVAENGNGNGKGRKKVLRPPVPPALLPIVALGDQLNQESAVNADQRPISLYGLLLTSQNRRNTTKTSKQAGQNGTSSQATSASSQQLTPAPFSLAKGSELLHTGWFEVAPTLLKEIEQFPAIFLLNPLGSTSNTLFTYDDLLPLYQRTHPTEICLLLSHKQVAAQFLAASRSPAQGSLLSNLLRTDRWKTLSTQEEDLPRTVEQLLGLFTASMHRHFQLPVQRIPLLAQVGPATVEALPHTLIFATRRQDSLQCMNDAVCQRARTLYEQSYRGVLGEDWFTEQQRERFKEQREQIQKQLLSQGRAQRIRRWPDLRQQLLLANFGHFTAQDYDLLLHELLVQREVRCQWRHPGLHPAPDDTDQRIPGNDDTLLWR